MRHHQASYQVRVRVRVRHHMRRLLVDGLTGTRYTAGSGNAEPLARSIHKYDTVGCTAVLGGQRVSVQATANVDSTTIHERNTMSYRTCNSSDFSRPSLLLVLRVALTSLSPDKSLPFHNFRKCCICTNPKYVQYSYPFYHCKTHLYTNTKYIVLQKTCEVCRKGSLRVELTGLAGSRKPRGSPRPLPSLGWSLCPPDADTQKQLRPTSWTKAWF